jgi:hypothetical protein
MSSQLFTEVKKYLVVNKDGTFGKHIAWNMLDAGNETTEEKEHNVRRTTKSRVRVKAELLRPGYLTAFPMMVRMKPTDADDQRPWVYDGLHRHHGIGWLLANEPPPAASHPYTRETPIPTVLYKSNMPDSLCRRYGMLTNDLQQLSHGGTALDVLRFLANETKDRFDRGLGDTAVALATQMNDLAKDQGLTMESIGLTQRIIRNGVGFNKVIGTQGLLLAEKIQDYDHPAVWKKLMELSSNVDWSSTSFRMPTEVSFWLSHKDGHAFLPRCNWLFENIATQQLRTSKHEDRLTMHAPSMLLWCAWARYVLGGGSRLAREQVECIRNVIISLCVSPPAKEGNILVTAYDDLQFLEELMKPDCCGSIVPQAFTTDATEEGKALAEETFLATMQLLAVAPILTKAKGVNQSLVSGTREVMLALLEEWYAAWESSDKVPKPEVVLTGKSFAGMETKKAKSIRVTEEQAALKAEQQRQAEEAKQKEAAEAKAFEEAQAKKQKELEEARLKTRQEELEQWEQEWNDIEETYKKAETSREIKAKKENCGTNAWGWAVIGTSPTTGVPLTDVTPEEKKDVAAAQVVFLDMLTVSHSTVTARIKTTLDAFGKHMVETKKDEPFKGRVAVLCRPSSMFSVVTALQACGYTGFDQPYNITVPPSSLSLHTTCEGVDDWGVHSSLLRDSQAKMDHLSLGTAMIIGAVRGGVRAVVESQRRCSPQG